MDAALCSSHQFNHFFADVISGFSIKYPNPPIQEALCEVHFAREGHFQETELEKMRKVWTQDFSDQRLVKQEHVHMQIKASGMEVTKDPQGQRLICRSSDGTNLVQLAADFLVVNRLPPYPGWQEFFSETIQRRTGELQSTLGTSAIKRVGLRYINRLVIPQEPLVWEEWFNVGVPFPIGIKSQSIGFQIQIQRRLEPELRIIVNCVTLDPSPPGTTLVMLDLDVIWEGSPLAPAALPEALERVHLPHRLAFEGYLTDRLRALFY